MKLLKSASLGGLFFVCKIYIFSFLKMQQKQNKLNDKGKTNKQTII